MVWRKSGPTGSRVSSGGLTWLLAQLGAGGSRERKQWSRSSIPELELASSGTFVLAAPRAQELVNRSSTRTAATTGTVLQSGCKLTFCAHKQSRVQAAARWKR